MDTENDKIIKEQFESLPDKLKRVIASQEWLEKIRGLTSKYNLNGDQAEGLKQETFLTLLAIEPFSAYRNNLVKEALLTYDQALKISFDANNSIFASVIEELKQVEKETEEAENMSEEDLVNLGKGAASADAVRSLENTVSGVGSAKSDHMIVTHEEMVRTDGPHPHSQTFQPTNMERPKPVAAAPNNLPGQNVVPGNLPGQNPPPKFEIKKAPISGSPVDQKLSGLTRGFSGSSPSTPAPQRSKEDIDKERNSKYKSGDPYREPIE